MKTLELNFFITKYNDLSDKSGVPVSIYALNFGLCQKENINWGKPKGSRYRKYFIERLFNYNKVISDFLQNSKIIFCSNILCNKQFNEEHIPHLEFNNYKCNACASPVATQNLDQNIREAIENIDSTQMLPIEEIKILQDLKYSEEPKFARDISQEIDYSKQMVSHRAKKLSLNFELIHRVKDGNQPYKYFLTEKGKNFFTGWKKL